MKQRKRWWAALTVFAMLITAIPSVGMKVSQVEAATAETTAVKPVWEYGFEDTLTATQGGTTGVKLTRTNRWTNPAEDLTGSIIYGQGRNGGKALSLDGSYGVDLKINPTDKGITSKDFTISLWMKPKDIIRKYDSILNLGYDENAGANWISLHGWGLWYGRSGKNNTDVIANYKFDQTKEWTHIAISKKNNILSIFRNGVFLGSSEGDGIVDLTTENVRLRLGANYWDPFVAADYDDIKIYDQALKAYEIESLYQGSSVNIKETKRNLYIGQKIQLDLYTDDTYDVSWSYTSDCVQVDQNGVVTAIKEGTATITAKATQNGTEIAKDTTEIFVQKKQLLADFTFDNETDGFKGAGAKATIMESEAGTVAYTNKTLDFSSVSGSTLQSYVAVTKEDNSSLLANWSEFTVSFDMLGEGTHKNSWPFYVDQENGQPVWSNTDTYTYLAISDLVGNTDYTVKLDGGHDVSVSKVYTGQQTDWKHIDAVYKENSMRLYINGIPVSEEKSLNAPITDTLDKNPIIWLGRARWANSSEYWKGSMDNFKIYNYARTENEIAGRSLVASYDMSYNGDQLLDQSGRGNHGTLVGFTIERTEFQNGQMTLTGGATGPYVTLPQGIIVGESFRIETEVSTQEASNQWLWYLGNTTQDGNNYLCLSTRNNAYGVDKVFLEHKNNGTVAYKYTNTTTIDNQMHHLAVDYDHGYLQIILDGELIYQTSNAPAIQEILANADITGCIGYSKWSADPEFKGTIKSFKIYATETVNKDALWEAIQNASGKTESEYTPVTWSAFATALENANNEMTSKTSTDTTVTTALNNLVTAETNLVRYKVEVTTDGNAEVIEYENGWATIQAAKDDGNGNSFLGWKEIIKNQDGTEAEGMFVCYTRGFRFEVVKDMKFKAVYGTKEASTPTEEQLINKIALSCTVELDTENNMVFTARRNVPAGLAYDVDTKEINNTLAGHGMILYSVDGVDKKPTAAFETAFVLANVEKYGFTDAASTDTTKRGLVGRLIAKVGGTVGRTYFARPYVQWIDASGNTRIKMADEILVYSKQQ